MGRLSAEQERLPDENVMHKKTMESVYEKWTGPMAAVHHNEDLNTQAALKHCAAIRAAAQKTAPTGRKFGVETDLLSNRAYSKGDEASRVDKGMLSNRKY